MSNDKFDRLDIQGDRPILIEFSNAADQPQCLKLFFEKVKLKEIKYKKSVLPEYQINIFYVLDYKSSTYKDVSLENIPSKFQHAMTIFYQTPDNYSKIKADKTEGRLMIVREDLQDDYFSLEFEIENVVSKIEGLNFLCDLTAAFINRMTSGGVQFYDRNAEGIFKIRKDSENILKETWVNILYQIPGLGREKCLRISQQFPTYQSIYKDYNNEQKLKQIEISRGKKSIRLGQQLAKRIYKVLLGKKYHQSVI